MKAQLILIASAFLLLLHKGERILLLKPGTDG